MKLNIVLFFILYYYNDIISKLCKAIIHQISPHYYNDIFNVIILQSNSMLSLQLVNVITMVNNTIKDKDGQTVALMTVSASMLLPDNTDATTS